MDKLLKFQIMWFLGGNLINSKAIKRTKFTILKNKRALSRPSNNSIEIIFLLECYQVAKLDRLLSKNNWVQIFMCKSNNVENHLSDKIKNRWYYLCIRDKKAREA